MVVVRRSLACADAWASTDLLLDAAVLTPGAALVGDACQVVGGVAHVAWRCRSATSPIAGGLRGRSGLKMPTLHQAQAAATVLKDKCSSAPRYMRWTSTRQRQLAWTGRVRLEVWTGHLSRRPSSG